MWLKTLPSLDWQDSFIYAPDGVCTIVPGRVPDDGIASLVLNSPEIEDEELVVAQPLHEQITESSTDAIKPKGVLDIPKALRHGPVILGAIWGKMRKFLEIQLPFILLSLSPEDFFFREIAFGIVSLASGFSGHIRLEDTRRIFSPRHEDWLALRCDRTNPYQNIVVSELGAGFHKEGIDPGSAPSASTYWFHGVLIQLEANLQAAGSVKRAISKAVNFGRESVNLGLPFDILLISIEHIIIVRVLGDNIQRTRVLPLLNIPTHHTEHPRDRYSWTHRMQDEARAKAEEDDSQSELDDREPNDDDEQWEESDRHSVRSSEQLPDAQDAERDVDQEQNKASEHTLQGTTEDNFEVGTPSEKDERLKDHRGYRSESSQDVPEEDIPTILEEHGDEPSFALVHLFESAIRQSLPPERVKEGIFPTEIYEIIFRHIDYDTWQQCSLTSRKFRGICQRFIHLAENVVVTSAFTKEDYINDRQLLVTDCTENKTYLLELDFTYWADTSKGSDGTAWMVLNGEYPRLSQLIEHSIRFRRFQIPCFVDNLGGHTEAESTIMVRKRKAKRRYRNFGWESTANLKWLWSAMIT